MNPDTRLLDALTQSADAVATLTDMRAQFIEAGWSEQVAVL